MGPMPPYDQRQHRGWVTLALGLIAALAIALAHTTPQPEPEREVRIRLTNGQFIRGVLVERTDTHLKIRNGRILTTIERADIQDIELLPTFEEQYEKLRTAITDADTPSLLRLVEWLVQHDRRDLAIKELDALLARHPANVRAEELRVQILAQIKLLEAADKPKPPPQPKVQENANEGFPLLTPRDINIIKVFEIDADDPPRLEISRATIEKMMIQFAGHPRIPATHEQREAMFRMPPAEILKLMFELRARDLYGEVKVMGHPESIRRFKTDVHRPWIQTRCVQCHNITSPSKLRLYDQRSRANSDQAVYTNFLILNRFVTSDGKPLIDVEQPERSPLLQIALARQNSIYPHPEVIDPESGRDLFVPAFRTTKERRFKQAVEWIKSLYTPRVPYPIELPEIPHATAPTKDASDPAEKDTGLPTGSGGG
jgi:hypothetical protein